MRRTYPSTGFHRTARNAQTKDKGTNSHYVRQKRITRVVTIKPHETQRRGPFKVGRRTHKLVNETALELGHVEMERNVIPGGRDRMRTATSTDGTYWKSGQPRQTIRSL